jgi:hypothetical protein
MPRLPSPISCNRKEFEPVRALAPVTNTGPELALRTHLAPGMSAGMFEAQRVNSALDASGL